MNSRLRSGWYLTLSPAFTLPTPNTCKMKCITANPWSMEEGSPLSRAYLLLLSPKSPLKSYPDLCFSISRLTAMCSHWQANSFCLTPTYLYVLTTSEAEIMDFLKKFFCSRASQKTLCKVRGPCCPRRCCCIAIPCCCYSCFSNGRQDPEVFSKQRCKDEFTASRNRTGGAESHQLLDYDLLWSFAGQAFHEGIDT